MCFDYEAFVTTQWADCYQWHGLWCQKKKIRNLLPILLPFNPLLPFTNRFQSNFVTLPADLNSYVAGANEMWVVWGFDSESVFTVPVKTDSFPSGAPKVSI